MPSPPNPTPIQDIRLVPVVDFAEYEYGRSDLELPRIDYCDPGRDAAFAAVWRKQLDRRGLGDAVGLEGRPELLHPDGLTTDHLRWLLVDHVAETEADRAAHDDEFRARQEEDGDEAPDHPPLELLEGGVAMLDGTTVLTSPYCCADFGDLDDWVSASEDKNGASGMLWIGHPWLNYHVYGGRVLIEEDASEGNDNPACWSVRQADLRRAVGEAREVLRRLRPRIRPVVEQWRDAHTPAMEPPWPVGRTVEWLCGNPDDVLIPAPQDQRGLLHETDRLQLRYEDGRVWVRNRRSYAVEEAGVHAGNPECGVIAPDESWAVSGGEGVLLLHRATGRLIHFLRPSLESDPNWKRGTGTVSVYALTLQPDGTVRVDTDDEARPTWILDPVAGSIAEA